MQLLMRPVEPGIVFLEKRVFVSRSMVGSHYNMQYFTVHILRQEEDWQNTQDVEEKWLADPTI